MSKGSKRRPMQVSDETFAERWAAIFGNDSTGSDSTQDGYDAVRCSICGSEMVEIGGESVCRKLLEQQGMDKI